MEKRFAAGEFLGKGESLDYINNHKELVYSYLNMKHSYSIFDEMIDKYHLEPSNHLVDLIYEAIIHEVGRK